MSKNCDIHIKGADGALRSVLYCRDNISPQCIRPIIVRAVEIANENASSSNTTSMQNRLPH